MPSWVEAACQRVSKSREGRSPCSNQAFAVPAGKHFDSPFRFLKRHIAAKQTQERTPTIDIILRLVSLVGNMQWNIGVRVSERDGGHNNSRRLTALKLQPPEMDRRLARFARHDLLVADEELGRAAL